MDNDGDVFARLHTLGSSDVSDFTDDLVEERHILFERFITSEGTFRPIARDEDFSVRNAVVELFSNERDIRMEEFQDGKEAVAHDVRSELRDILGDFVFFDGEVGEFVAHERNEVRAGFGEMEFFHAFGDFVDDEAAAREDPLFMQKEIRGTRDDAVVDGGVIVLHVAHIHPDEARDVPELVHEHGVVFHRLDRKIEVAARCITHNEGEAESVGGVLGDDVEGIYDVAPGFGHLAASIVENEAVQVDGFERRLSGEFVAHEEHFRHPEWQDVVPGF